MIFLKGFFEKVDFEKNEQTRKIMKHYLVGKELKPPVCHNFFFGGGGAGRGGPDMLKIMF